MVLSLLSKRRLPLRGLGRGACGSEGHSPWQAFSALTELASVASEAGTAEVGHFPASSSQIPTIKKSTW